MIIILLNGKSNKRINEVVDETRNSKCSQLLVQVRHFPFSNDPKIDSHLCWDSNEGQHWHHRLRTDWLGHIEIWYLRTSLWKTAFFDLRVQEYLRTVCHLFKSYGGVWLVFSRKSEWFVKPTDKICYKWRKGFISGWKISQI